MKGTHKSAIRGKIKAAFSLTLAAALLTLFFFRADVAVEYMRQGLKLCAQSVIPSLFPYIAISELLLKSGILSRIAHLIRRPARAVLGLGESSLSFFVGALCGFPLGAKTAAALYDAGEITHGEAERALLICNNPGAAFCTSLVGGTLLGSRYAGALIYLCCILSAVILSAILRLICGDLPLGNVKKSRSYGGKSIAEQFSSSVSSAALGVLNVTAFIVFFSGVSGALGSLLSELGAPDAAARGISALLEISGGLNSLSLLREPQMRFVLCSTAAAWSGLSVHFQVLSTVSGRGFSSLRYLAAKAAQASICSVLSSGIYLIARPHLHTGASYAPSASAAEGGLPYTLLTAFAVLSLAAALWNCKNRVGFFGGVKKISKKGKKNL